LCARQNDKILPTFPIWDDVQTFDGNPWRGIVDVVSGGFPCQDISTAGKGGGITGSRSSMWKHMARIIGEVRPQYAFVENSPMLTNRGLGTVLGDLASLGFDAEWGVLSAADVGANHKRDRIWIVARNMDKLPPKSEMALLREATVARLNRSKPANLRDQVSNMKHWPTPLSSEHKANLSIRENHQNGLTAMVLKEEKNFPTPAARDYKGAVKTGKRVSASGKIQNYGEQLPNIVGGNLNPTWVEWLMGWPPGWTNLKPLETDKSHYVQQQHGNY
jgi:site-specific DNA-cytosine methylase